MPRTPAPLDNHQQELVGIVKAAHDSLILARKLRSGEIARRTAEAKLRLKNEYERAVAEAEEQVKIDVEADIARLAAAQDEALIVAYNEGIPIRRIALDGFGNQHDAGVHQVLAAIRDDGRLGNRLDYRGLADDETAKVEFPKPVDMTATIAASLEVEPPIYSLPQPLVLVEPSEDGTGGVTVPAVTITMDARDPYFASIIKNARPGTPHLRATTATLYLHPATGNLVVHESRETGAEVWDHPVARYVKDHPDQARAGFDAAMLAARVTSADA